MGALTISAVDHTTGNLTITAHGQVSGAGPALLFNGVGGVIPTGLTGSTDYYLYVVDANTVRLCDSQAHALAGTSVAFSTNGTLPLSLGLGLPYRRARTYAVGQQVKSADLDALQDDDAVLFALLNAQPQSVYSSVSLAVPVNANAGVVVPTGQTLQLPAGAALKRGIRTISLDPHKFVAIGSASQAPTYLQSLITSLRADFVCSGIAIAAGCPVDGLWFGDRIVNARFYLKDVSGQTALTCSLVGGNRAGSGAVNAVSANSAGNGTTQTITLTALNHTVGTTSVGPVEMVVTTVTNVTGTFSIFAVELDVDTP